MEMSVDSTDADDVWNLFERLTKSWDYSDNSHGDGEDRFPDTISSIHGNPFDTPKVVGTLKAGKTPKSAKMPNVESAQKKTKAAKTPKLAKTPNAKPETPTNKTPKNVEFFKMRKEKRRIIKEMKRESNMRTLFVKFRGLNAKESCEEFAKKFREKSKQIRTHKKSKRSFYLEFESSEAMEAYKTALEGLEVNGEKAIVDYVGERRNPKKLCVYNIPKIVTPRDIKAVFKGCSAVYMPHAIGNTRANGRFCFVYYNDASTALQALKNASNIKLENMRVYVTYAKDKVDTKRKNRKPDSVSPAKKQKENIESLSAEIKVEDDQVELRQADLKHEVEENIESLSAEIKVEDDQVELRQADVKLEVEPFDTPKVVGIPKAGKTPKAPNVESAQETPKAAKTPKVEYSKIQEEKRRKTKEKKKGSNMRTLFVKFSIPNAKEGRKELVKKFREKSKSIRRHRKFKHSFYVEFKSSEAMEANKTALESIEVNGEKAIVDYVGDKSKNPSTQNAATVPKRINPKKLCVKNLPRLVTVQDIKEAFKGCSTVELPHGNKSINAKRRFCFVCYDDESTAQHALKNASKIKLGGMRVYVTYAEYKVNTKRKKKRKHDSVSPAKKQKVEEMSIQMEKVKAAAAVEAAEVATKEEEEPLQQKTKTKKSKTAPTKEEKEEGEISDEEVLA